MSVLNDMTDEEKNSMFLEKFGDVATYHLLPTNPAFHHTAVLANGRLFTELEWREFQHYVFSFGRKIKASWHDGLILIEECNVHGIHQAGLAVILGTFYIYNRAVDEDEDILVSVGQADCHVGNSYIQPDASFIPLHGATPSIFIEIANTQHMLTLIDKAELLLRYSHNNRYVVLVKVWRDPNPDQVAIVIAVWRKVGNTATPAEREAIVFTSFGTRPPTNAELASFPVAPAGFTPWVPALTGVIDDPESVPCNAVNAHLPLYNIAFQAANLFNVPGVVTPADYLVLPDLNFRLYRIQRAMVDGMVTDIRRGLWNLTNAELGQIVNNVNPVGTWKYMYDFAVERYIQPH